MAGHGEGNVSDGILRARFEARFPDGDWEAELAAARRRRDRSWRNPWNRLVHRVHAARYPELHRQACSACRGAR